MRSGVRRVVVRSRIATRLWIVEPPRVPESTISRSTVAEVTESEPLDRLRGYDRDLWEDVPPGVGGESLAHAGFRTGSLFVSQGASAQVSEIGKFRDQVINDGL